MAPAPADHQQQQTGVPPPAGQQSGHDEQAQHMLGDKQLTTDKTAAGSTKIDWRDPKNWHTCPGQQTDPWWSSSIINAKNVHTFSASGIVLNPHKTRVLCSWPVDMGSLHTGCSGGQINGLPFSPYQLKDMLDISLTVGTLQNGLYNEVLIDAKTYDRNLPHSILAFVYFYDAPLGDRVEVTRAYLDMLDAYNLTEKDVPLLSVAIDQDDYKPLTDLERKRLTPEEEAERERKPVLVDESNGARQFLELHSISRYREHHPADLGSLPSLPSVLPS
jgi:hypothetical protein